MKKNYLKYGFEEKPDNKKIAEILGVSENQLYKYFRTTNLLRETVLKITDVFDVTEKEIWGEGVANADSAYFRKLDLNMYMVPKEAFGEFLARHIKPEYMESLHKVSFPWINEECFAFEIEGFFNFEEYLPSNWIITTRLKIYEALLKGRMYIVQTDQELMFRQFDYMDQEFIYLKALNNNFNPINPVALNTIEAIYEKKWTLK